MNYLALYGLIVVFGVPIFIAAYEKTRPYIGPYLGGFAAVLIAYVLEGHLYNLDPSFEDLAIYYAPVVEEFAKAMIIIGFTNILVDENRKGVFWVWLAIGLGFGLGENGLYSIYLLDDANAYTTIMVRTVFPVALHIVTTILTGWLIEWRLSGLKISYRRAMLYAFILAAPSMVIHYIYNFNAL